MSAVTRHKTREDHSGTRMPGRGTNLSHHFDSKTRRERKKKKWGKYEKKK